MATLLIVGGPAQRDLLQAICRTVPIAAVLNPSRQRLDGLGALQVFSRWEEALETARPDLICILTPFGAMNETIMAGLRRGAHILTVGPLNLSSREQESLAAIAADTRGRLHVVDRLASSRLHQSLMTHRSRSEFGKPVYVRILRGGGTGVVAAWWGLWDMLGQSLDLLRSPLHTLSVVANRDRRSCHATATVTVRAGASGLLCVLPSSWSATPDILLLGTGGTISSQIAANAVAVLPAAGVPTLCFDESLYAEPEMLNGFLRSLDDETGAPDARAGLAIGQPPLAARLLRGLKKSLRTSRIVDIDVHAG